MNSRDRVRAAITNSEVDRPPVSVWRHFPTKDQTAEDLAKNTADYQKTYNWDFVKFMPPGDYPTIDWGATTEFEGAVVGNRSMKNVVVKAMVDWSKVQPIDVSTGFNGMVLEAMRLSRERIDPDVPILQTIFSPLTIAQKLVDGHIVDQLRSHPDTIHTALKVISEVTSDMVQASYEAGADGIFFASQMSSSDLMNVEEYEAFGRPYDLLVLEASRRVSREGVALMHTHGDAPMLELAKDYPVDILNWHDQSVGPSVVEGQKKTGKAVAGGINERSFAKSSIDQIQADVRDTVSATEGHRILITPGCVIPYQTPESCMRAVREAIDSGCSAE